MLLLTLEEVWGRGFVWLAVAAEKNGICLTPAGTERILSALQA